jgi:hypothetical protein
MTTGVSSGTDAIYRDVLVCSVGIGSVVKPTDKQELGMRSTVPTACLCVSLLQCVPGDAVRHIDWVRIPSSARCRVIGPRCSNPPQPPETEEQ